MKSLKTLNFYDTSKEKLQIESKMKKKVKLDVSRKDWEKQHMLEQKKAIRDQYNLIKSDKKRADRLNHIKHNYM